MAAKARCWRWLVGAAVLAAAECAVVVAVDVAVTTPAQAQYYDEQYPFLRRQRPRSGGFFQDLFGGFDNRVPEREYDRPRRVPQPQPQVDYSRAPPPRKPDAKADSVTPTTSIVVMGGSMADWLASGLEDAFADSPEVAVVRKDKPRSGLIRYQFKSDLDWWHVARDTLSNEKANYVVMMLGVNDRQNIRERDVEDEAEKTEQDQQAPNPAGQDETGKSDQKAAAAPEPKPEPKAKNSNGVIEFRTDRWAAVYSHRIDETIAALKSKGVPVFWVGLPSIRGTKSTADAVYLNDLFRARAERDGAVYIDVWDGFVDESGKYSNYGPDYEGQMRRLRSGDGVFFTKYGARKLAHYVEREIRRYMNNRALPVALPSGPLAPMPGAGQSAARPLAGPVVPLTVAPGNAEVLAGGAGASQVHGDSIATQVLVKGEPVSAPPGRADDFGWPPGSGANKPKATAQPPSTVAPKPAVTGAAVPAPAASTAPATVAPAAAKQPVEASKPAQAAKSAEVKKPPKDKARTQARRSPHERTVQNGPRPPRNVQSRAPRQQQQQRYEQRPPSQDGLFGRNGLFGWTR